MSQRAAHARFQRTLGPAAAALLLAMAVLLCYANSLRAPLIFDDRLTILENPTIRSLRPPWLPLRTPPGQAASGRPVFNLTLAINHAISGREPWSYRAANVGIHVLAACTLFGIMRRTLLTERLRARYGPQATALASACALLWAVHPLHTQAVTYISQRSESLMGLFLLLTLYGAVRGWQSPKRALWHGAAAASAILGAGSKEIAAVAPLLVLTYDRVFVHHTLREALRASRPLYLGLLLAPLLTAWLLATSGQGTQAVDVHSVGPVEYLRSEAPVLLHYLRLSIWPDLLVFDYDWPIATWREAFPHALVLLALLAASLLALWRWPALGFLGVWFFVILAPTSSVIPMRFLAFEYRMYLPLAAVVVLVVLGLHRLGAALAVVTVTLAAVALGTATVLRNRDYRSELAIWQDTVVKRPHNPRAHANLGRALIDAGERERARAHFEQAVRLAPDDPTSHLNLGGVFDLMGRTTEARSQYEETLALRPGYAEAHNNLAHILLELGETERALDHYAQALRAKPEFAGAHYNLGRALLALGHAGEAAVHLREALRLEPGFTQARELLERLGSGRARSDQPDTGR